MDTIVIGIQKISIFMRGVVEVANFAPFPYYIWAKMRLEELQMMLAHVPRCRK